MMGTLKREIEITYGMDHEGGALGGGGVRLTLEQAVALQDAIMTLLPGLRVRNYVERWAVGSPAVQALNILVREVEVDPAVAGELVDPGVPSAHPTPPEATKPVHMLRMLTQAPAMITFCGLLLRGEETLLVTVKDDHVNCPACMRAVGL